MIFILLTYFQQYAYYNIKAYFDDSLNKITGKETILYKNNSPDSLDTLYLNTFFNSIKPGSRLSQDIKKMGWDVKTKKEQLGWVKIKKLTVDGKGAVSIVDTGDVSMAVLTEPVPPGMAVNIEISFEEKIPYLFSRMGYKGKHYEMAYWFPQICVYDSKGWHTDGYRAEGEFYNEFGDFDVELDVPAGYVVMGTGKILGDSNYLQFLERKISGKKMGNLPKRWKVKFRAERVHNFVWVADRDYIIKKTSVGSTTVYVLILKGDRAIWGKMIDRIKRIIETYNKWYGHYDYPSLVVADGYIGSAGGMEYPNIVVINTFSKNIPLIGDIVLEDLIAHEIGHQWFFGMLGNNEMDYAWLDEGFTSFTEERYIKTYYPSKQPNIIKGYLLKAYERGSQLGLYKYENSLYHEPVIGKKPYNMRRYYLLTYTKGKDILWYIHSVLGEYRFNMLMHDYFENCKFTHPSPEDFFSILRWYMDEKGVNFVKDMLYTEKAFDVSVDRKERGGFRIEKSGDFSVPVKVITYKGEIDTVIYGENLSIEGVKKIILDPENGISETDEWNNQYPRKIEFLPISAVPDVSSLTISFIPYVYRADGIWMYGIGGYITQGTVRHNGIYSLEIGNGEVGYYAGMKENIPSGDISFSSVRRKYIGYDRLSLKTSFNLPLIGLNPNVFTEIVSYRIPDKYYVFRMYSYLWFNLLGKGFNILGKAKIGSDFYGYGLTLYTRLSRWLSLSGIFEKVDGEAPTNERIFIDGSPYYFPGFNAILPFSSWTGPLSQHFSSGYGLTYYSGRGINFREIKFLQLALGRGIIKLYGRMALTDEDVYKEICLGIRVKSITFELPLYPFERNLYKRWVVRIW